MGGHCGGEPCRSNTRNSGGGTVSVDGPQAAAATGGARAPICRDGGGPGAGTNKRIGDLFAGEGDTSDSLDDRSDSPRTAVAGEAQPVLTTWA
jgi:hypothetical protein